MLYLDIEKLEKKKNWGVKNLFFLFVCLLFSRRVIFLFFQIEKILILFIKLCSQKFLIVTFWYFYLYSFYV